MKGFIFVCGLFCAALSFSCIGDDENPKKSMPPGAQYSPPPSFQIYNGKAVFVDFKTAHYKLTYDITQKTAQLSATMQFEMAEEGYPIFDLVPEPTEVTLDGQQVNQALVKDPDQVTKLRVVQKSVALGAHQMTIKSNIGGTPTFGEGSVRHLFGMSDLDDRNFLERYVPANLEFDQLKMTFDIHIDGLSGDQDFFTNGVVTAVSSNHWQVEFPAYFNSSSLYFHMAPKGYFKVVDFQYPSIDGRSIPVRIYGGTDTLVQTFRTATEKSLKELESRYGAWRHPSLTVYAYNQKFGGMEYCGATMTELYALNHELTHSYFARGVMPAHGNSGWIDEAVTTWSDKNLVPAVGFNYGGTGMAAHSPYRRATDRKAYSAGAAFMAHLDNVLKSKGGLRPFLNKFLQARIFKPMTTVNFQTDLSSFYGQSVDGLFHQHIYASDAKTLSTKKLDVNPYHKLTEDAFLVLQ